MAKDKNPPITLTGAVYCSWNVFAWIRPAPASMKPGDMIIWSWSGNPSKPQSSQKEGVFKVSVFDGKDRRNFTVYNTRVHPFLKFKTSAEREQQLRSILAELVALRGQTVVWNNGGYEVSMQEPAA